MPERVTAATRSNVAGGVVQVQPVPRKARQRTKAGTQDNRVHNRTLVLQHLYSQGAMSRSDLARASALTAPTVSALVAELETEGLVSDIGPRSDARVGKPANLVRIVDSAAAVLVIDLSHNSRLDGALVDLRGTVLARASLPIGETTGEAAYAQVVRLGEQLRDASTVRLLGIGVGSPGIINDDGFVRLAVHRGWTDLPLAQRLSEHFGLPARVGNDINVAALGVLHFRQGTPIENDENAPTRDAMVVSIENGVGVGLIVGGRLVEGQQFAAGEIGHVTVDDDGEVCLCGRRGCLDVAVSSVHLRPRVDNVAKAEREVILASAGRALGKVLAPIASVLDLSDVVLTGPADLVDGAFVESVRRSMLDRILSVIHAQPSVRSLAGDTDLVILGAASLVLSAELGVL